MASKAGASKKNVVLVEEGRVSWRREWSAVQLQGHKGKMSSQVPKSAYRHLINT